MAMTTQPQSIDVIDKVDLQLLTQPLIYWQRKADEKTKSVMDAFESLSKFYRVDQLYEKTITRPSIRRGLKRTKTVQIIYQYSKDAEETFEKAMSTLETETSAVYPILLYLLERLYHMKPESEITTREEVTEANPEFENQPGMIPEKKITTESQNTFARMFSFLSKPKVPDSIDDIASPYRRTHDIIEEIQNIPPLLERLNSFHELRITDAQVIGYGKYYQMYARESERYFLKAVVKPKLLKIVHAGNMINIEMEQKKIVSVLGLAYREKNIHRPFEMQNLPQLPPPPTKQF